VECNFHSAVTQARCHPLTILGGGYLRRRANSCFFDLCHILAAMGTRRVWRWWKIGDVKLTVEKG